MANETKTSSTPNASTSTAGATAGSFPGSLPGFDPMAAWAQGQQMFTKLMTDSVGRWETFAAQYASIEQQVASHATTAVNHWAQLAKDAIAYGQQLSAEARKLSVETAKKMGVSA